MERTTRYLAIVGSLLIACAALQASPATKKPTRRTRSRADHASYHTARYRQHSRTSHRRRRRYRHYRHYRRRRRYYHRVRLPKEPSRERIRQIQTALERGGYYQGDPNGRWDADTIAAVQKFQSAHDLDATGKLDAPTLQKLGLGSDIAGVAAPKPVVPKDCCSVGPVTSPPKSDPAKTAAPVSTAAGSGQNAGTSAAPSSTAAEAPSAHSRANGTASPAPRSKPAASQP